MVANPKPLQSATSCVYERGLAAACGALWRFAAARATHVGALRATGCASDTNRLVVRNLTPLMMRSTTAAS
jgi:hypothetical protein